MAQSRPTLCDPRDCSPWKSSGQNTRVGSLSLLQRIFLTQGLKPGFPHCRQILYQLSHKGSPFVLRKFFALLFIKYQSWLPSDGELILKDMMKCFESILKKCLHMLSIVLKAIFFFFFATRWKCTGGGDACIIKDVGPLISSKRANSWVSGRTYMTEFACSNSSAFIYGLCFQVSFILVEEIRPKFLKMTECKTRADQ